MWNRERAGFAAPVVTYRDMNAYVSGELTHFVGRGTTRGSEQYDLMLRILRGGWLTHPPHPPHPQASTGGDLRVSPSRQISDGRLYITQVICFCDIPVPLRRIHMNKYSEFGISFGKDYLVKQGASPVFYIASSSTVRDMSGGRTSRANYFDQHGSAYQKLTEELDRSLRSQNPEVLRIANQWLSLQHMLDFHVFSMMKFFDPALDNTDENNFYMEREWRLYGNLNFKLADVVSITLPDDYKQRLSADLPDYQGTVTISEDAM
jgi:hypothetical protein